MWILLHTQLRGYLRQFRVASPTYAPVRWGMILVGEVLAQLVFGVHGLEVLYRLLVLEMRDSDRIHVYIVVVGGSS